MKNFKKNGGFTLVELIVVIAILAILAAVAIPAYSGYIEKANAAGDQTLIAAVNRAFTSALTDQGLSNIDIKSASVPVDADGKMGTETLTLSASTGVPKFIEGVTLFNGTIDIKQLNVSFAMYFSGNETAAFKTIKDGNLVFDLLTGTLVDAASVDTLGVAYGDAIITVSGSAVKAFKDSNWGDMPSSSILQLVGGVTDVAGAIDSDAWNTMLANPVYSQALVESLGMTQAEYEAFYAEQMKAVADAMPEGSTPEQIEAAQQAAGEKIMANNAVLLAAQGAQTTGSSIISVLTANDGKDAKNTIKNAMTGSDPAAGLSQAALAYGLYTSYKLDSDPNYDPNAESIDLVAVMNSMDDPAFQKYLTQGNGKQDLEGYLAALNTVAGNSTQPGVGTDIVVNGFDNNQQLADLLQQALGK